MQASTVPTQIIDKIEYYSELYQVDFDALYKTVECESGFDPKIQSGYYHAGVRERSYGLAQINLPSHPSVTLAQATDPDYALNFMARNFARGEQVRRQMWTCYDQLRDSGKI